MFDLCKQVVQNLIVWVFEEQNKTDRPWKVGKLGNSVYICKGVNYVKSLKDILNSHQSFPGLGLGKVIFPIVPTRIIKATDSLKKAIIF